MEIMRDRVDLGFVERYNRLHEIAQTVIEELIPNGVEVLLPFIFGWRRVSRSGSGEARDNKEAAAMMQTRLATIHDLLPRHKIRDDFRRVRAGREEPLPLYVRNEIHHPTTDGLAESTTFQQDKRIGYAIMEAWLSEDD